MGILGAAGITGQALIDPSRVVDDVEICAIAARDPARAEAFAKKYGIEVVHPTYEALLEDTTLDAIYNPLPNSMHAEWTIAALEAGRHVLCEKPFASNASQAAAMVDTAERCQRVLVEAFHWRFHPVASRMIELGRLIGPLRRIEAQMSIVVPADNIRFVLELGGGSFMDQGSYCVHMVRAVVGAEPDVVRAAAVEGPRGVDVSMEADLAFEGVGEAVVSSTMVADKTSWPESMTVRAWGLGGQLEVLNPLAPQWGHRIRAKLENGSEVDEVLQAGTTYEYQLRAFCRAVAGVEAPITGGADAVANMRTIDAVYEASGLGTRP
jgi:predicted dehydrogenase